MARILVVGDKSASRSSVADPLRALTKHVVDECADGADAVRLAGERDHDLILVILGAIDSGAIDVAAQEVVGFDVLRSLRRTPRTRGARILLLASMQRQQDATERLKELGLAPDDLILCPIGVDEVIRRIEAALRLKAPEVAGGGDEVPPAPRRRGRSRDVVDLADELRGERDTLREIFEAFEDGLILMDRTGEILVANGAGLRLSKMLSAADLEHAAREVARGGATSPRFIAAEGTSAAVRAYPVSGGRVLLSLRDVTEERDDELRRLQAEKLASIGMLAAGVAHEINNPAAFVIGNIDALGGHMRLIEDQLRRFGLPNAAELEALLFEAKAILQESKEGMARIQRIVRDLSAFSHRDDDKGAPLTSLNAAVDSTLAMLRVELRHRATVERELRSEQLVQANPARLGQVFLNLVMNAVQAMQERDPSQNKIVVRTYDRGPLVVFEVTDNGPGIPTEAMDRIFDSFFTTKPPGVGTGLGLPISQGIVRSLGGQIEVESQPGSGATFRVLIPAAVAGSAEPAPVETPPPVYGRRRILAVDDEALLLKAYRRMLSDHHDVTTALGGRDALRILEKDAGFDLVLCDLQMPEMSGMELHRIIQASHPALADRFVFVTGGAYSAEAKSFLEQAVACINKPFRIEELLLVIEQRTSVDAVPRDDSRPTEEVSGGTPSRRPATPAVASGGWSASPSGSPKRIV